MSTRKKWIIAILLVVAAAMIFALDFWVRESEFVDQDACLDRGGSWQGKGNCVLHESALPAH